MQLLHTFTYRKRLWLVFSASMPELKRAAGSKSKLVGVCDYELARIYVWKKLSRTKRERTIWHEIGHAVNWGGKIGLTHKQVYKLERELGGLVRLSFRESP